MCSGFAPATRPGRSAISSTWRSPITPRPAGNGRSSGTDHARLARRPGRDSPPGGRRDGAHPQPSLPSPAGLPWRPISEICPPGEGAVALFLGRTSLDPQARYGARRAVRQWRMGW